MHKLVFFVPESHLEQVKNAVFSVGSGRVGDYEACCWQVLGVGQFRPIATAAPYVGTLNQLETLPEYRVEMVCEDDLIAQAVVALKAAHPYETPAYETWRLADF